MITNLNSNEIEQQRAKYDEEILREAFGKQSIANSPFLYFAIFFLTLKKLHKLVKRCDNDKFNQMHQQSSTISVLFSVELRNSILCLYENTCILYLVWRQLLQKRGQIRNRQWKLNEIVKPNKMHIHLHWKVQCLPRHKLSICWKIQEILWTRSIKL